MGTPPVPGAPPPQVCVEPAETQPEGIGDPGNAGPGTRLTNPTQLVDAGIRIGTAYCVMPSSQPWWVATGYTTPASMYQFQCTDHDSILAKPEVNYRAER